jgi:Bacterial Ig-like domain
MIRIQRCAALVAALGISACGSSSNGGSNNPPPAAFAETQSNPADNATGVATNAAVVVLFNRAPNLSSVTAALLPAATVTIAAAPGGAAGVSITANGGFAAGTAYTLTVKANDAAGEALAASFVLHFTTAASADTTAPAAVADLSATATSATAVHLTWTATGDDGTTGTAAADELRFGSGRGCPLTAANFAGGTLVTSVPNHPHAAGTAESADLSGLSPSTTYCFAMRVSDGALNVSGLSNVATATTPGAPDTTPPAVPVLTATPGIADVSLGFTAVGDDGNTGIATKYTLAFVASPGSCPQVEGGFVNPTILTSPARLSDPRAAGTA